MEETVQSIVEESTLPDNPRQPGSAHDLNFCTRCLQPLPYRAQRCPGCGQPAKSRRALPLLIGVAGVFALLLMLIAMWRVVANEDINRGPAPVDQGSAKQEEILPETPPGDGKAKEPEKPPKRPPLDER